MVEKMEPIPHTALPNVNQSARWNSRIMEKGFMCAFLVPIGVGVALQALFDFDADCSSR